MNIDNDTREMLLRSAFDTANRNKVHRHQCSMNEAHIWSHSQECDGNDEAHHCPSCGAGAVRTKGDTGWQVYFGPGEPITEPQMCYNPVYDLLEKVIPAEVLEKARKAYDEFDKKKPRMK